VLVDEHMVSSVVKVLSTLPAFGVTLHLAFQDAHALVKADRFGQVGGNGAQSVNTLLGVLGTHWLFYQGPASAREIGERLELSGEDVTRSPDSKLGRPCSCCPTSSTCRCGWSCGRYRVHGVKLPRCAGIDWGVGSLPPMAAFAGLRPLQPRWAAGPLILALPCAPNFIDGPDLIFRQGLANEELYLIDSPV